MQSYIGKALERVENDGFNDNSGNGTDKAVAWATIAIATSLDRIADSLEKLAADPVVVNNTVNNPPVAGSGAKAGVKASTVTPSATASAKKPAESTKVESESAE